MLLPSGAVIAFHVRLSSVDKKSTAAFTDALLEAEAPHLMVKRRLSESMRAARPSVIRATASVLHSTMNPHEPPNQSASMERQLESCRCRCGFHRTHLCSEGGHLLP